MRILGIETSCDETGAAIIKANQDKKSVKLLSNVVASSLSLHAKTGGIIPEVAAREQLKFIIHVLERALKESNLYLPPSKINHQYSTIDRPDIDAIAVTVGPGLIGSLLVGVETAKTLAYAWNKPIIPVNHLIGHIYANFIDEIANRKSQIANRSTDHWKLSRRSGIAPLAGEIVPPQRDRTIGGRNWKFAAEEIIFPAIALIVSGGHTDLVLFKKHGSMEWLGGTRDDAAGEAFDKIGRLLNLPYPGGPAIAKVAEKGNPKTFKLPRPMVYTNDFDFSFSGLKTAVLREVKMRPTTNDQRLIADLSASVQQAIVDILVAKTIKAAQNYKVKSILLSGGVAANDLLRNRLGARSKELGAKFFAPPKNLCTDNAAMIATAAFFNYKPLSWEKITADPSLHF